MNYRIFLSNENAIPVDINGVEDVQTIGNVTYFYGKAEEAQPDSLILIPDNVRTRREILLAVSSHNLLYFRPKR